MSIHNMIINDNIKSIETLGTKYYYNIGNLKELKKVNKYTSPLNVALHTLNKGEYCIKYDEEAPNAKTYIKYGNYDYNTLNKHGWKINNHLFEIIPQNTPFKLYFDIDKRFESEEDTTLLLKELYTLIKKTLNLDMSINSSICKGEGKKDGYLKISYHIIINNGVYFENMDKCKIFMKYIEFLVNTNDDYTRLRNGVFDFNVYKNNQAFKLPYQSKAFKKIIQIPSEENAKLSEYLLTHINDKENMKFYDVSKFEELMKGKNINNKIIKDANGKNIKLDFNEAIIIKQYTDAIEKGFILGDIKGSKKDGLPYYLDSIPNNSKVPRIVWKTIGFCISKITKNSEEGLKLWTKWTNAYKPCNIEELREAYMKHDIIKGYGWNMLFKLASLYNKKFNKNEYLLDPLFNDKPTYKCIEKTINEKYISNGFNMVEIVNDFDIINIKSPMGSGKSWTVKQVFNDTIKKKTNNIKNYSCDKKDIQYNTKLKYEKILYLSCKRAFATAMLNDFKESGFKSYLDFGDRSSIKGEDRIICSVESALHLKEEYDLVIIDESESICDNLTGEMMKKNKPIENITKIHNIIKNSKKVMIMDAYLSERSFNMVKDILGDEIQNKKCYYLKNDFQSEKRELVDCIDKEKFVGGILEKLKKGERCVVVCGSKKLSDIIVKECKDYKIKNYNSNNPLKTV